MSGPRPHRLRHVVEYALVRAVLAGALSLGPEGGRRVARAAAGLFWRLDRKHRERALGNLAAAMPELSAGRRTEIARDAFESFATTFVEALFSGRLLGRGRVPPGIELVVAPEARDALARGRGAIFVSAHIGNWELTGQLLCLWGWPPVSVARPVANPLLDRWLTGVRERLGQRVVAKRGALRELTRAVRDGGYVAMLVDQNAGRHGVFAEFFGRPASTTGAPATLALKYDVPLIPGWQVRRPGAFRHRMVMEAPLAPPATGDRERDVLELTRAMNARVEAWVREAPEQWLWGHRRWKARPPGEREG